MDMPAPEHSTEQGQKDKKADAKLAESIHDRISAFLEAARKDVINAVALVAIGFVVWSIAHEMTIGDYEVMSVEVPASLAQRFSGEVVSAAIRDGIAEDWRKASNSSPINVIQRDKEEPEIAIGGTNLPLRYVAKVLRRVFGHPLIEITGQMVEISPRPPSATLPVPAAAQVKSNDGARGRSSSPMVRLTLRNSEVSRIPYFNGEGALEDVLQDAALASLEQIDPFAAVLAGSQGTFEQRLQALRLAKTTLAKTASSTEGTDAQRGKALLAAATAFYGLENGAQAEDYLKQAIVALSHPAPDHRLLSVAQDGLAIIYIQAQDWLRARKAVEAARDEQPDYDSAKYHAIEIEDKISRSYFGIGPDHAGDACLAESSYEAAVKGYSGFISDNPNFSIAYTQLATMRLIHLNWLRRGYALPNCPNVPQLETLEADTKDTRYALEQAVNEDAKNEQAWFQYANLLYELQDPQYLGSEHDPIRRGFLLTDAERNYRKTLDLETNDYYVWFRYAEALAQDTKLRSSNGEGIQRQAVAAYCKSIVVNRSDLGLIEAARTSVGALQGTCTE